MKHLLSITIILESQLIFLKVHLNVERNLFNMKPIKGSIKDGDGSNKPMDIYCKVFLMGFVLILLKDKKLQDQKLYNGITVEEQIKFGNLFQVELDYGK